MIKYSIYPIKKDRSNLSSFCPSQLYPAASSHPYTAAVMGVRNKWNFCKVPYMMFKEGKKWGLM